MREWWTSEAESAIGPIDSCARTGGNAAADTFRVLLRSGETLFCKSSRTTEGRAMLLRELSGLNAIAATQTIRVPEVIACGGGWLLLEWLRAVDRVPDARRGWEALGRSIAAMHSTAMHSAVMHEEQGYGFGENNYIGTVPQTNDWSSDWPAFWRDSRLAPLINKVVDRGMLDASDRARFDTLLHDLDNVLGAIIVRPSLLHGDLWSGNVMITGADNAAIFDPSCYYGHREVDLAMAALFGGFEPGFFDAYNEALPMSPDYSQRRAIYQLYYLLAHMVMFGDGYHDMTMRALRSAGY